MSPPTRQTGDEMIARIREWTGSLLQLQRDYETRDRIVRKLHAMGKQNYTGNLDTVINNDLLLGQLAGTSIALAHLIVGLSQSLQAEIAYLQLLERSKRGRSQGSDNDHHASVQDQRTVGVDRHEGTKSPAQRPGASASALLPATEVCRDRDCPGVCGHPYWDGPGGDTTARWQRIAQHSVNSRRGRRAAQPAAGDGGARPRAAEEARPQPPAAGDSLALGWQSLGGPRDPG